MDLVPRLVTYGVGVSVARLPVQEVARFFRAALVKPVGAGPPEPDAVRRRRRTVSVAVLVAGAALLAVALRVRPGDALFYPLTLGLAVVWAVGAVAAGPLHLGRAHTRAGTDDSRGVLQSVILGALLVAVFLAGAVVVSRIPVLRQPVEELLDHARYGSLPVVTALTLINGVAEELYFRGALYAAVPPRRAVWATTAIYTGVTAVTGIPLLTVAAAILGVITALQRRVTGGILAPAITHLIWSTGMLFLLPSALTVWS